MQASGRRAKAEILANEKGFQLRVAKCHEFTIIWLGFGAGASDHALALVHSPSSE